MLRRDAHSDTDILGLELTDEGAEFNGFGPRPEDTEEGGFTYDDR